MHTIRFRFGARRPNFRKKHRKRRGSARTGGGLPPRLQALDPAFDGGRRAFLEGWLRAEHIVSPTLKVED